MFVQCLVEDGSGGGVCHGGTVCTGMRKRKSMEFGEVSSDMSQSTPGGPKVTFGDRGFLAVLVWVFEWGK